MSEHFENVLRNSDYWIAGDDAYSCDEIILTPYSNVKNDPGKSAFNFFHSSLRMKIENCFGVLVARQVSTKYLHSICLNLKFTDSPD
mmetsp:Transcript_36259/g.45290  ORF Transcript_36259/g.45290 Transcript_36259/m.45290 type:complete len:87 (-) Transcript_36259:28-288(-)